MRRVRRERQLEVDPDMPCVWVLAVQGSGRMREGRATIRLVQPPVDRRLQGRSSVAAVAREARGRSDDLRRRAGPGSRLPILPGPQLARAPGALLRAGVFTVTTELDPPTRRTPRR